MYSISLRIYFEFTSISLRFHIEFTVFTFSSSIRFHFEWISNLGGRTTRAPPDPPIHMGGAPAPPTPSFYLRRPLGLPTGILLNLDNPVFE